MHSVLSAPSPSEGLKRNITSLMIPMRSRPRNCGVGWEYSPILQVFYSFPTSSTGSRGREGAQEKWVGEHAGAACRPAAPP